MGKLFVGLIFTMLGGVRLMVGTAGINIMPAFVGYILMALAFRDLESAEAFRRSRAVAWLATAVSAVAWVLDIVGGSIPLLMLGSRTLCVYLTWMVAVGVGELEGLLKKDLIASLVFALIVAIISDISTIQCPAIFS